MAIWACRRPSGKTAFSRVRRSHRQKLLVAMAKGSGQRELLGVGSRKNTGTKQFQRSDEDGQPTRGERGNRRGKEGYGQNTNPKESVLHDRVLEKWFEHCKDCFGCQSLFRGTTRHAHSSDNEPRSGQPSRSIRPAAVRWKQRRKVAFPHRGKGTSSSRLKSTTQESWC